MFNDIRICRYCGIEFIHDLNHVYFCSSLCREIKHKIDNCERNRKRRKEEKLARPLDWKNGNTGKKRTPEIRKKQSEQRKGKIPWNKGKKMPEGFSKKISEANMGNQYAKGHEAWNKGLVGVIKLSKETRKKMSDSKKGEKTWSFGKHFSEEHRKNLSESKLRNGSSKMERNPNWQGGLSFEPYGVEFSKELKKKVKELYDNKCVLCGSKKRICIHHIDYCKQNNNEYNLIPLCTPHHTQTNYDREKWEKELTQIVRKKQVDFICKLM